jgi:hypothetical protein
MAARPKTQQAKALITRTVSKEWLLDAVATGWTQQRIADHVTTLTGQPISTYYVCRTLQSFGPDYDAAKKAQAQYHAERIADISDKVEEGKIDPASARISSENRKWVAARLDPSTYGDRVQQDITLTNVTEMHLAAMRDRLRIVSVQDKETESLSDSV